MKIGMLFSGQGSQYPGMGLNLYENYEPAKQVFDEAGDEIKEWCFNGTKEMLRQTSITQPSVYTVSIAAYKAFIDELNHRIPEAKISAMAGFSMGEYAALTASGVISDFETALNLIKKRGQYMTAAGLDDGGNPKGAMAAAFGKREKILACVDGLRGDNILECVNFNSPIQTAIAGDIEAIDRLCEKARADYGIKVKKLSVSSAFHSSMMDPASIQLKKELEGIIFQAPRFPLYSNITGRNLMEDKPSDMDDSDWIGERLTLQVKSPVYWQETIENMRENGIDVFVEVGPGKTLSSLASKTLKDAEELHVEDKESMENTIARISELID